MKKEQLNTLASNQIEPIVMRKVGSDEYESSCGYSMQRENGKTPSGNNMNDRLVLRDKKLFMVDYDQYRNDIFERNNIKLVLN